MRTSVRKKNKTQNKTEQNRIRNRNETPIPVLFSAPYPALSCLIILTESCQPMVPLKNKAKNSVYYPKKSSFRSINLNLIEAAFIPQLKKSSMRLRFLSLKLTNLQIQSCNLLDISWCESKINLHCNIHCTQCVLFLYYPQQLILIQFLPVCFSLGLLYFTVLNYAASINNEKKNGIVL